MGQGAAVALWRVLQVSELDLADTHVAPIWFIEAMRRKSVGNLDGGVIRYRVVDLKAELLNQWRWLARHGHVRAMMPGCATPRKPKGNFMQ